MFSDDTRDGFALTETGANFVVRPTTIASFALRVHLRVQHVGVTHSVARVRLRQLRLVLFDNDRVGVKFCELATLPTGIIY